MNEGLKIAMLQTPTCPLNLHVHGGMERNELLELKGLQERGHTVRLYVSRLVGSDRQIQEIRDLSQKNRVLKLFYYFNFWVRASRFDIFHGHFTPILALLFPGKSLIHFQGNAIFELPLYRYFAKRYQRSRYVFCSDYTRQEFEALYPSMDKRRLMTLHNSVDSNFFCPPVDRSQNRGTANICFYAGWIPEKGIYDVLEAAQILEERGRKDFKIYYGGSAHSHYRGSRWGDADEIDRRVKDWAKRLRTVELAGDLRYEDLPGFLQKMDIGLVPSAYQEPFGIVNIEMMACGLPVIATRVGGIPEIVVDGKTGLLIEARKPSELAAKIEILLDHPGLRSTMGKEARKRVEERFALEKHIAQLEEIYRAIKTDED